MKDEINELLTQLSDSTAFKSAKLAVDIEQKVDQLLKLKLKKTPTTVKKSSVEIDDKD